MENVPILGVDLGFGYVKVAGPGYRDQFPSLAVEPGSSSEPDGLVEWGRQRFLIGEGAIGEIGARYSADDEKVATAEELCKFMAAIARACDHYDTSRVRIATGLPPAHYKRPHQKQQMVDNLAGMHTFRYNGKSYLIHVNDVQVDPQAGAAFYDYLLLDDGSVNPANADLVNENLRSIIVDPGWKTTDVYLAEGRKAALKGRSLLTINTGVWSVWEEVSRILSGSDWGISKTPEDLEAIHSVRQPLRVSGRQVPLSNLLQEAAGPIAKAMVTAVKRHCEDTKLWDVLLLAGGGAHVFGKVLARELAVPVRVNPQPEFANAAGYFKRQMEQ